MMFWDVLAYRCVVIGVRYGTREIKRNLWAKYVYAVIIHGRCDTQYVLHFPMVQPYKVQVCSSLVLHVCLWFIVVWYVRISMAFDSIVTAFTWLPTVAMQRFRLLSMFRAFRIGMALRCLSTLRKELSIILTSLADAFIGLIYVLSLIILFLFCFALLGTLIFKESDPYAFGNVYTRYVCLVSAANFAYYS